MRRDGGLCQPCLQNDRVTPATDVDHIVLKAAGGTDADSNLQAICRDCHRSKTAAERIGTAKILPSWMPRPCIPVLVVCGPPGSGKNTYVAQHADLEDLIIDLDEIIARRTGQPKYIRTEAQLNAGIFERNELLASLSRPGRYKRAWLIVTAGTDRQRQFWKEKLNSQVVVMTTPKIECIRRIKADLNRPAETIKAAQVAIELWE